MDTTELTQPNKESLKMICERIQQEAQAEVTFLKQKAQHGAEKIMADAKTEAEKRKNELLLNLEEEQQKIRERVFSTLNLEKKKIVLQEKEALADKVLAELKTVAAGFRQSKEYIAFLQSAIDEGAKVINTPEVSVVYSPQDEKLINDNFRNKGKYKLQKGDFADLGVIVRSAEGRLLYDNRFAARFKRKYDEIYSQLIAEAF
jgi:vacuolar-type H+-ATPase subunit E/Vma4